MTDRTDDLGSQNAFPLHNIEGSMRDGDGSITTEVLSGLTKRELFAAMAMQGIIASRDPELQSKYDIARFALSVADELLTALDVSKQP